MGWTREPTGAVDRSRLHPALASRRTFLGSSAVIVAGWFAQQEAAAAAAEADIIDAHVHVWTPDTQRFPLAKGYSKSDMRPLSFTPKDLMQHAQPVGVVRVVLIQMSFYQFDNSYMLHVIREQPQVYAGVAVINPLDRPAARMKELAKQGVRGFRIRPGNASPESWLSTESMQSMWTCGAEEGLAMCHLIDPEYLPAVDRMCQRFPQTPVVIDHFARIGIDGSIAASDLDNLCRLARFPQVAVKVSAFYALGEKKPPYHDLAPMVRRLRDAFGAERLMWASDCPFQVQDEHTYRASIDLIKDLDFLSRQEKVWILGKTAARIFFS